MAYDSPETLTASKITNFTCPLRYKYLYVDGLRDESDPARRGSTIHTANEFYVAALVEAGMASDPELAADALHRAFVAERTPAHLVPECEDLWAGWIERFELDLGAFLEAEKRRVDSGFSFKPDMVFARPSSLDIEDLKTHYQGMTEAAAKKDLQARFYAYLASRQWPGFERYTFTFRFIRLRQSVTATFEPAELDAVEMQLAAHAESISAAHKTGEWPAAPGDACQYCSFRCPVVDDPDRRLETRLVTHEDALRAAGEILALSRAAAVKKVALAGYCASHGPVVVGTQEFAHRPMQTKSYPASAVLDTLRLKECDTSKLVFGSTALKPYQAKKWAHVWALLSPLVRVRELTMFSVKKVGVTGDAPEEE